MCEIIQAIDQELRDRGVDSQYLHNFAIASTYDGTFRHTFSIEGDILNVACEAMDCDPQEPYPAWWYNWSNTQRARIDLNDPEALGTFLDMLINHSAGADNRHGADRPSRRDRGGGAWPTGAGATGLG